MPTALDDGRILTIPVAALRSTKMTTSQKDSLVVELRAQIVSGILEPGMRINLDAIASQHGVSRMPVRDAMKQLESEGLVTVYPRRGVVVSALDPADITELYGIRIALERLSLELAVPRLTDANLAQMKSTLQRMDGINGWDKNWAAGNERFHNIIIARSGWPRLSAMIITLRANVERYINAHSRLVGTEMSQRQHWAIYEACRERDVERAKDLIAEHLRSSADDLVAHLRKAS
jgi:DNA-binding GntR family transcriptional regulator